MKMLGGVLVFLILCSCTSVKHYQRPWPNVNVDLPQEELLSAEKNQKPFPLSVVEFDEFGDFLQRGQLSQSLEMIQSVEVKPLLITFVHGWRHNARPADEDLKDLHRLIARLNSMEELQDYTACGLFIGWRGAQVDESFLPGPVTCLPAALSFWNRKAATDRVADIGLARVLSHTSKAAWAKNGRVITIGHSFGARILEKTIGTSMAAQSATLDTVKLLADFTVLINPASESLTARKLKLALDDGWKPERSKTSSTRKQPPPPLLVAIGAENDLATGIAWPLGYKVARLFGRIPLRHDYQMENGETDEQAPYLKLTTTNDQYQLTHSLKPVEGQKSIEMDSKTILRKNLSNLQARADDPIYIRSGTDGVAGQWRLTELDPRGQKAKPKWWRPDDRKKIHLTLPSNAYWVFEAPKEILSGHGGSPTQGVITNQMLDLLLAMIARANLPDRADGGPTVKIDLDSTGSSRPLE